jgi:hypothetical protein
VATVIAEIGSTHGNSRQYLTHAAEVCARLGAWLKIQVFEQNSPQCKNGNIAISEVMLGHVSDECMRLGVPLVGSFWNEQCMAKTLLFCDHGKIAYSARKNTGLINAALAAGFDELFVSGQHLDQPVTGAKELLCIPEYPVYYQVCFDGVFERFGGFSDHTIGVSQSKRAIAAGAEYIEKHVAFAGAAACPDTSFSISESELKTICGASEYL